MASRDREKQIAEQIEQMEIATKVTPVDWRHLRALIATAIADARSEGLLQLLKTVDRIELGDSLGRTYVRDNVTIALSYAADGQTLRVFVAPLPPPTETKGS